MKSNHTPAADRLKQRISRLEARASSSHVPSHSKGNPYWMCRYCHIHDPELSIQDGRHFSGCPMQGIQKEIAHYKRLLSDLI